MLNENAAPRPDEIVPNLDQPRAEVSDILVDGIGMAGASEFFLAVS
jgi:hypothetical protein